MQRSYDVVIAGGGAIGSSIAYWLMAEPGFSGSVLVVEKDPSYRQCSTTLSAASIRQQFSTPANIEMSKFGIGFLRDIGDYLTVDGEAPDVGFRENGYLFLVSEAGLPVVRSNHEIQSAHGAQVALLGPDELGERFPWLALEGLAAGSLGLGDEGWFDPWALLQGFRKKARALGAEYADDTVTGLTRAGDRITAVTLAEAGDIACGAVVNAAGFHAAKIAAMAGLALPVEPRKRIVYVFDCRDALPGFPLLINPNGVWCRPEGANFITGVSPPAADDPPAEDFEVDYRWFEEIIWPTLAERIPAFAAIKVINAWACHYAYNTFDQNAILGPHPEVGNFHFANGFSGHGLQQSPAVGRGIAELIAYGAYKSLDLSVFGHGRIAQGTPVREINVV